MNVCQWIFTLVNTILKRQRRKVLHYTGYTHQKYLVLPFLTFPSQGWANYHWLYYQVTGIGPIFLNIPIHHCLTIRTYSQTRIYSHTEMKLTEGKKPWQWYFNFDLKERKKKKIWKHFYQLKCLIYPHSSTTRGNKRMILRLLNTKTFSHHTVLVSGDKR